MGYNLALIINAKSDFDIIHTFLFISEHEEKWETKMQP